MAKRRIISRLLQQPSRFRLIVHAFVEGGTELDYLQNIAKGQNVRILGERTDSSPVVLLGAAMKWCVDNARILRTKRCVDTVWVIFDEDEKVREIEAVRKLWGQCAELCMRECRIRDRKRCGYNDVLRKINVAFLKPCIELWALMCLPKPETGRAQFSPSRHVLQSQLNKLMPTYDHSRHPYFDVSEMTAWREACAQAAEWERTFGNFPDCLKAPRFAGIATLVEMIQTAGV